MNVPKIKLAYKLYGNPSDPVVIIVQGLGMPLTATPPKLVKNLVKKSLCLLLIDNRDIGQSDIIDIKPPNIILEALKYKCGFPVNSCYSLKDMMNDINNLLESINVDNAHIIGVSMGGMIAQLMAIHHPGKIKSLTSIMSTSGNPKMPGPHWDVAKFILSGTKNKNINSPVSFYHQLWRLIGSPVYPRSSSELDEFVDRIMSRGMTPGGSIRQILAILSSSNRCADLTKLNLPTLVIHGDKDKLVPVECGIDTAECIPNAKLWLIPGMGHDFPYELLTEFTNRIADHLHSAENKVQDEKIH
jgi:pimeloyl-ACP methyl ester carboxylesterase